MSWLVTMPSGRAPASTTTSDPTLSARISAAASATVTPGAQVSAGRFTSERSGRANACCSSAIRCWARGGLRHSLIAQRE